MSGLRRRRALAPMMGTAVLLLAGCNVNVGSAPIAAGCRGGGDADNPVLVLMAQAVPTAALVPCIRAVPAGWRQTGRLHVRNGRASFTLGSDAQGDTALSVLFTERCQLSGATSVPSDQPGSRRYERPRRVLSGYVGERYYVYPGGCTTYHFQLNGSTRALAISEAASAVGFVQRSTVADIVRRASDGRLHLDPSTAGETSGRAAPA